ncbi:LysM peptidoglycan-binding domain-containing protein [Streptococcus suis]|nr:LysM peptidoglycan-binding domain-containing protein [Streptococcus suis]MCQ8265893.1 LysM peptidoglycan-binding domain-containing protein [Streptococcus suis]HEL9645532.1 LysM peptidoglycan-binding domain-containing protein [Streptococcus suis]
MNTKKLKSTLLGMVLVGTIFIPVIASADTYTVKAGDTLSEIAQTHNTTVDSLVSLNKIANRNLIHVGQVIELGDTVANKVQESTSVTTATAEEEVTATTITTGTYASNLSAEDAAAKEWIAMKESGGNYTAQNGIYYGRYQLTNTYLNGDYSPENQERVADAYVANRYGSWSAAMGFWMTNGWY